MSTTLATYIIFCFALYGMALIAEYILERIYRYWPKRRGIYIKHAPMRDCKRGYTP